MKNILTPVSLCGFILLTLAGCTSVKETTPSRIGLVSLHHYNLKTGSNVTDTVYRVIQNEDAFNSVLEGATPEVKRPDFNGQMVVAILLKPSTEQTPLLFEKAETVRSTMNVYAQTCSPGMQEGCTSANAIVATTPKVGSVKRVEFFINGASKRIVNL